MVTHWRKLAVLSLAMIAVLLGSLYLAGFGRASRVDDEKAKKASAGSMAKGETARKAIEDHRRALAKDGVHACCINPSCVFCACAGDMCPCAENLEKGEPVCPECWGGWQAGHGHLDDVDAAKVKIIPKDKLKMMYDMKAENMKKTRKR